MSREPKIDRVEFQEDLMQYFRDVSISPFTFFDNGHIYLEQPEDYRPYTDTSGIDTLVIKIGTSILDHKDYRRMIYNMNCLSEDLTRLREERNLNIFLVF